MQIVQAPDTVLSTQAKKVEKIDKSILDLIADMKHALLHASDPEGVGIAAPQVGRSLQIFLMKPEKDSPITVVINPTIKLIGKPAKRKSKSGGSMLEGCLSLKDIWGTVERPPKVHIKYLDETGKEHEKTVLGWPARIIQHEYDHLDGIVFAFHIEDMTTIMSKSEYKERIGKTRKD